MTYTNPWIYQNEELSEEDVANYVGFVYLITELPTGRKYIGKKIFLKKVAKPPLKGKKKRRISKVSSDWKEYYGSNDELKRLVELYGESKYKREILKLCKSKSEMSYFETKEIFARDALVREEYFNSWVSARIQRNTLKGIEI